MKTLRILLIFFYSLATYSQLDQNTKAKLYFIEAEKQFNQTNFKDAILYIDKVEQELGFTSPRILTLKIKSFYSDGQFLNAQEAFNTFINEYKETSEEKYTSEILKYFVRIEKAVEELNKREERENLKKLELEKDSLLKLSSVKHYKYIDCNNSQCISGKVKSYNDEKCWKCNGSGKIEKSDVWQAISNGLNETNKSTTYYVSCTECKGKGSISKSKRTSCRVCGGSSRLLKYSGDYPLTKEDIKNDKKYKRDEIIYFVKLKEQIKNSIDQPYFPIKSFNSGLFGICDRDLNIVTNYKYDDIKILSANRFLAQLGGKNGVISYNDDVVIPLDYSSSRKLNYSLILDNNFETILFDLNGTVINREADQFLDYINGYIIFESDLSYGLMDEEGNKILREIYSNIEIVQKEPLILLTENLDGKFELKKVNILSNNLFEGEFDSIKYFIYRNLNYYHLKSSQGFIIGDNKGKKLLERKSSHIENMNNNLISFKTCNAFGSNCKYGLYDLSNNTIIEPEYDEIFLNINNINRAIVTKDNLWGAINAKNEFIIPLEKIRIWFYENKSYFISQSKEGSNKRYIHDKSGKIIDSYRDN